MVFFLLQMLLMTPSSSSSALKDHKVIQIVVDITLPDNSTVDVMMEIERSDQIRRVSYELCAFYEVR